jgi:hypothetical protein
MKNEKKKENFPLQEKVSALPTNIKLQITDLYAVACG